MSMVTSERDITIPAGKFKARCLALLDLVSSSRQVITITKRGRPVARLVPLAPDEKRNTYGWLAGLVTSEGDIVSPLGERWEAEGDG